MTMITPSYLGETIEYSSLHACRSTLEDPTIPPRFSWRSALLDLSRQDRTSRRNRKKRLNQRNKRSRPNPKNSSKPKHQNRSNRHRNRNNRPKLRDSRTTSPQSKAHNRKRVRKSSRVPILQNVSSKPKHNRSKQPRPRNSSNPKPRIKSGRPSPKRSSNPGVSNSRSANSRPDLLTLPSAQSRHRPGSARNRHFA